MIVMMMLVVKGEEWPPLTATASTTSTPIVHIYSICYIYIFKYYLYIIILYLPAQEPWYFIDIRFQMLRDHHT